MTQVFDILQGTEPDPNKLYANFKPVRYRYVMAYLRDHFDSETGTLYKRGEVMAILPMTQVSYAIGMYVGTEMSGSVALPEQTLDLMPHKPLYDFERIPHPDVTGSPVGSMFECGNRAIYVMRNGEVVWGGILWTRSYDSSSPMLNITALSFEGYIYYRLLRLSIIFPSQVNMYVIWYAVMKAAFTDFNWMVADASDGRDYYDSYTVTTDASVTDDGATAPSGTAPSGADAPHAYKPPKGEKSGPCRICGKAKKNDIHDTNEDGKDGGKGHGKGGKGKDKGPHWVPGKPRTHKDKQDKAARQAAGQEPFKPPAHGGHQGYDNEGRPLTEAACQPPNVWKKKKKKCIVSTSAVPGGTGPEGGDGETVIPVKWTGINGDQYADMPCINYVEQWPGNCPDIELPPPDLKLYYDPENNTGATGEMMAQQTWHGYDMNTIGAALQEWADTETIASYGGGKRFEYKVVCWFDHSQQRFRQRYIVGTMSYPEPGSFDSSYDPNNPIPNGIIKPSLGNNTKNMGYAVDNPLVFDYPGNIAAWSLSESMEEAATRWLVTDDMEEATKHVGYAVDAQLLNVPYNDGSQGWLLYDKSTSYGTHSPSELKSRAETLVTLYKVPTAAQLQDLRGAPQTAKVQRTSRRSTTLTVTLYAEPSRPLPEFTLGDWAAFAIEDPFYGGKMYLVRRIIGYQVTVVPEQESDYSHESITLELTDDNQIAIS